MEMILGIIVSLIVQLSKQYSDSKTMTLGIVLFLSVFAALVHSYLSNTGMLQPFLTVLTTAGAFYTFIIQHVEKAIASNT